MFQEPLTETRLGLDAERPEDVPFSTWAQLAWTDVTVTASPHRPGPLRRARPDHSARGLHFDGTGTSAADRSGAGAATLPGRHPPEQPAGGAVITWADLQARRGTRDDGAAAWRAKPRNGKSSPGESSRPC